EVPGVAVEVPIAAAYAVEREPGVAVLQAVVPDVPVEGRRLGLDRGVANPDEVVVEHVNVGIVVGPAIGRRGGVARLHVDAVIGILDLVGADDDLAADALRRQEAAIVVAKEPIRALIAMRLGPVDLRPELMALRVILLPLILLDQQVLSVIAL